MRYRDCLVAWMPVRTWDEDDKVPAGSVRIVPHPDYNGRAEDWPYTLTPGCSDLKNASFLETVFRVFQDFNTLVVRDGVDPQMAHREFLKVDEYRLSVSRDMDGASEEKSDCDHKIGKGVMDDLNALRKRHKCQNFPSVLRCL